VYTGQEEIPKDVVAVEFSSSVIAVPPGAFRGCHALKYLVLNEGLQRIGPDAFCDCTSLEVIKLPSTLVEIGREAFFRCSALRILVLNEGLQKIGAAAFVRCFSLESIAIPSTIREIAGDSFYNCRALAAVTLHEGLQRIGPDAFCNCTSLESVNLPSTMKEIDYHAFYICNKLRHVVFNGVLQKIDDDAFCICASLESIQFPRISTRLESFGRERSRNEILNKIHEIPYVEMVGDEIILSSASFQGGQGWPACKGSLDQIIRLITYYELKEATTIFELALWKMNIMQGSISNDADKGTLHMEVAGPVKEAVLQYFDQ